MLRLKTPHLDDFTLLRYVANDLDGAERGRVAEHLETCVACKGTCDEIEELDRELAALSQDTDSRRDFEIEDLPEADPFRRRPRLATKPPQHAADPNFALSAVAASEEGEALSTIVLDAVKTSSRELDAVLQRLDLSDHAHRFALFYAMQEAGRQIAENPLRARAFAEGTIAFLGLRKSSGQTDDGLAPIPIVAILGQAHQLAGQAGLWTGEFESARTHLELAYWSLGRSGDEVSLAVTELLESQRRTFSGSPKQGLHLIRRAVATFETYGIDDYVARAGVVEGLALCELDRHEEAIEAYRRALPVFERHLLWSNYVGAVNSIGTSLYRLGRLGDARREYSKALRRLSREQHRSWVGFIRLSLAEVLLSAGRYREAATSSAQAARVYSECGLPLHQLKASLFEVESWARANDLGRALHRLQIFREEVERLGALDPAIGRQIEEALSGAQPDFQRVSELRAEASHGLEERLGNAYA